MVIGLTGHFHAGKDEVARRLVARYGFRRHGFSDALKLEVLTKLRRTLTAYVLELVPALADMTEAERQPRVGAEIRRLIYHARTPVTRALLQEFGTEVRRTDDPDYWITALWTTINSIDGVGRIVIADTRFPNEIESIRSRQGLLVRVVRPGFRGNDHESERHIDSVTVDHEFRNDGTVEELWAQVDAWAAAHVR
jgi:hypothetical protein